jgi:ATP-dependent Clp protease ATP-binding subunit ClpA
MFERFTNHARHAVVLAQEEARKLRHNYIGTEHVLLGLIAEQDGQASRVLASFGLSLEVARHEVTAIVRPGKDEPKGHIPFTPRAKKTLELSLREALQLHHDYIDTEHILLGVLREGEGVGAQVLKQHADLLTIRMAVLDLLPSGPPESRMRRWLRRYSAPGAGEPAVRAEEAVLSATPAGDTALSEATRLAGQQPVGSHHLLLAALADPDTAAARALAALGVDIDQAKEALRTVDVTGTSDEQPEEAGRRQMVIHVADDRLTVEMTDPLTIQAGRAALTALGDQAGQGGTIPGDLPACAGLTGVWQALQDGLTSVRRRATLPAQAAAGQAEPDQPGEPDSGAA